MSKTISRREEAISRHRRRTRRWGVAAQAQPKPPARFSDPQQMAGASEAILRAKIVRGGMGSGMPYWGRLFGEQDVRALLSYLWGFIFSPAGQE